MNSENFQEEIKKAIEAQITAYSVPGASVLGGFIQRSRTCVAQYNGRQIFEMLQNMDDQMTEDELQDGERCSQIILDKGKGKLFFRNKGAPFSVAGIVSIMFPDVSPKRKGKLPTIGNKGLGFRSLLNWKPKEIIIRSNETELVFSDQVAFSYVKNNAKLKDALNRADEGKLPMLSFPEINNWENPGEGWVTEIELTAISEFIEDIEKELKGFDAELMLFLPHLRQVEISVIDEVQETKAIYQASKRQPILDKEFHIQARTIRKSMDGSNWDANEWLVCWDRGTLDDHNTRVDYNIEIAVPKEEECRKTLSRKLYNFLPVSGVSIKLPCLIHATVNLGDNRNELLIGDWQNRLIFHDKLPRIIEHFATVIRDQFRIGHNLVEDRWLPYNLLAAPFESDDKNYVGPLYEKLRSKVDVGEFVPCVSGEFRKPCECCYYEAEQGDGCNITQFFNAHSEFVPSYVLSGAPTDHKFPSKHIASESLRESINNILTDQSYPDEVLVELAYVLWRIAIRSNWSESGPYWLLHDSNGRMLGETCDNVYTPAAEERLEFPEYMNADFVDEKLWGLLERRFSDVIKRYADKSGGKNDIRSFCNNELDKILRIEYYDRAAAAKKIISSANEYLKEDFEIKDKREVVSQLLSSLWKNFRGDIEPHPRKEKIPLFVNENGEILYSSDFLFDDVYQLYDGKLDKKYFLSTDQRRDLLPEIEKKQEIAFFRYLGVRSDVRIKYVTIGTDEGNQNPYLLFLQRKEGAGGLPHSVGNGNALKEPQEFVTLRDPKIIRELEPNRFFDLLQYEKVGGLSELILETRSLVWKALHGKEYYPITVKWSYVAYQLNGMFENVIYGENDKVLSDLGWRYEQSRGDVPADLIMKLGAKSRFSDLSPHELYALLNKIAEQNINPTKDFYKKVNAAFVNLEKNGQKCNPPQGMDMKVFATWKENGVEHRDYCPVSEVYYHDNPAHVRALVRGRKMFFLGARVGVDSVCRHFGVQKLNEGLLDVKKKEMVTGDFQSSFENDYLKKCSTLGVILCRHASKSIEDCRREIGGIQIKLVSSIQYSYENGQDCDLATFDYIRDGDSGIFYLCVGELQTLSQIDNTGLRKLSRSLSGILCDTFKLSNDELEREFEGCFFDLETAKEDLKDLGYQDLIDVEINVQRNYYREYQEAFLNIADTIWSMFLKPTIWTHLNEQRNLQRFYRGCELGYRDFISKAKGKGGEFDRYCIERQYEIVAYEELRLECLTLIKHMLWLPEECRSIRFDWEKIERNESENWDEPTFSENYPNIDIQIDDELNEEVLSLMSFTGNGARIKELLSKVLPAEGTTGDMKKEEIVPPSAVKDLSLVEGDGKVEFLRPRNTSTRGLSRGSGQAMTKKRQKLMQKRGAEAESCVIKWLKGKGYDRVEGKSGTSLNSGRNDSLHYDISYVHDSKTYYVEVKACDSGEFHISSGELDFAKKNPDTYRLALVYLESAKLQIVDDVYNRLKDVMVAENWCVAIKEASAN